MLLAEPMRSTRSAPAASAAAASSVAAAADKEWSASDADEDDDEATVDADERAAAAQGFDLKVSCFEPWALEHEIHKGCTAGCCRVREQQRSDKCKSPKP